ncbi:putative D,D-dipeptide transport ATP-binding protein DdpD [compost metagenome]
MADYVIVMYSGKIVEEGEVTQLFAEPKHPYTRGLLKSKPVMGQRQEELYSIPGQVPSPLELSPSCYFHERCGHCMSVCRTSQPQLRELDGGQKVSCWLYEEAEVHA